MGLAFGLLTAIVNVVFGLPYGDVTSVASGVLHAIPFFGPFVSWLPPVAVALLSTQFPVPLIVLAIMAVGWFVTMNVLQPRLMAGAVGIHPIVVLGSVVVGTKLAGVAGGDLRHPDRGGAVGVLLPLVRAVARGRLGGRPGDEAARGARGAPSAAAAGARARPRRGRRGGQGAAPALC